MSKLEELIAKLCPNGVEYKTMDELGYFYGGLTGKSREDFIEGNAKFITYKNIYSNLSLNLEVDDRVKVENNEKQNTIQYGDVLFTGSSETLDECGYSSVLTTHTDEKLYLNSFCFGFRFFDESLFLPNFSKYLFRSRELRNSIGKTASGVTRFNVSKKKMGKIKIPIPPLEVQEEIVRILDKFTELTAELTVELTARKKQYEFYRDKLFVSQFNKADWCPLNTLILSLNTGLNPRQFFRLNTEDAQNYYVTIREIQNHRVVFSDKTDKINDDALKLCNNRSNLQIGDVLFSGTGTIGETAFIDEEPTNCNIKEGVYAIKPDPLKLDSKYLMYLLGCSEIKKLYMKKAAGGTVKSVPMAEMKNLKIPVPPLEEQKRIVEILDRFDQLCNDISEGLPAEIEARKKQYEYYRDQLLNFDELRAV